MDSPGNAGENNRRTVDCLWTAEESSNRWPRALVCLVTGAVELHSPLKTGHPGGTPDAGRGREAGACGGYQGSVVGRAAQGSRGLGCQPCRRAGAAGCREAPPSHTWRGLVVLCPTIAVFPGSDTPEPPRSVAVKPARLRWRRCSAGWRPRPCRCQLGRRQGCRRPLRRRQLGRRPLGWLQLRAASGRPAPGEDGWDGRRRMAASTITLPARPSAPASRNAALRPAAEAACTT